MQPKFYQVKATLVPAYLSDVVNIDGFVEDRYFFVKDFRNGKFLNPYMIRDVNCYYSSDKAAQELTVQYYTNEVRDLTKKELLYKISDLSNSSAVYLIIRTASPFDLFSGRFLKRNVIYYMMSEFNSTITGPFFVDETTKRDIVEKQLSRQLIYVLSKNQTFEPVLNKISA